MEEIFFGRIFRMQNASETASSCIAGGQEIASDDEYWRSFARVTSSSTAMLLEQHAYGLCIYALVALVGDAAAAAQVGSSSFGAVASSSHRTTQDANETYNSPRSVASGRVISREALRRLSASTTTHETRRTQAETPAKKRRKKAWRARASRAIDRCLSPNNHHIL